MVGALVVLLAAAALGGCNFLRNEFMRLDRAGPVAAGEQAPSAVETRDGP